MVHKPKLKCQISKHSFYLFSKMGNLLNAWREIKRINESYLESRNLIVCVTIAESNFCLWNRKCVLIMDVYYTMSHRTGKKNTFLQDVYKKYHIACLENLQK